MPAETTRRKRRSAEPTLDELAAQAAEIETLVDPEPEAQPKEFEPVELALGAEKFTIGPISRRGGAAAYDDSADFAIEAMPLISRLFNLAIAGQSEVAFAKTGADPEGIVADLVANLGEQDMIGLVREMRSKLPYLAMIACKASDPEITESRVKELAGSPLNPELTAIVFTQIMADRLLETMLGLGAGFGFSR